MQYVVIKSRLRRLSVVKPAQNLQILGSKIHQRSSVKRSPKFIDVNPISKIERVILGQEGTKER